MNNQYPFFTIGERVRATYEGKPFIGKVVEYNLDDYSGNLGLWVRHARMHLLIFYYPWELQKLR